MAWESQSERPRPPYRAPRTPYEVEIAGFWEELLDIERVGVDDEFVELGGNSLVATMLRHRLERSLAYRPTVTEIFSCTLGELASRCEEAASRGA